MNFPLHKSVRISLYIILLVFILLNLSRSFYQYYVTPIDGDIAESTLPYPSIQKTFDDPTGIKTIINKDYHTGANRFFSHYFLHKTYRTVPFFLQKFTNPIDSVYYTSAIAKIIIQILILLLFTFIIHGKFNFFSLKFIFTAALLIPFFQTNGKHLAHQFGILDKYASYCFFYALPLIFLLLYYLPLILELMHHKRIKMNWFFILMWSIIAIITCFSGPLNSPIVVITNAILFLSLFVISLPADKKQPCIGRAIQSLKAISLRHYLLLIPIAIIALYSTYLGTYIRVYPELQLTLKEMYLILPQGIKKSFTSESYIIFFILLLLNFFIVFCKYRNDTQSKKIFGLYLFFIIFSIIYLLVVPLGGYRPARPLLLRYDTILPITVLSIITICYTSLFILRQLIKERWKYYLKIVYPALFLSVLIFFLIKNKTYVYYECEKAALRQISNSKEDVIALDSNCAVFSWELLSYPEESINYGKVLHLWRITDKPKMWYNLQQSQ